MRKWRTVALGLATMIGVLSISTAAQAQVTWDSVKKKFSTAKDYEVIYKYDGPKGVFKFDYRCAPPSKVRSEILESKKDPSKAGTILVYDATWNKDKVRAKTGGGIITRNLTHKDVKDTPFYQSVFQLVADQIGGAAPKVSQDGDKTRFEFKVPGGTYTVWANKDSEITRTERIDGNSGREIREFSQIKWNTNPSFDF